MKRANKLAMMGLVIGLATASAQRFPEPDRNAGYDNRSYSATYQNSYRLADRYQNYSNRYEYRDRSYYDRGFYGDRGNYGHERGRRRSAAIIGGSAAAGAAIGGITHGGKGAAIGALSGGALGFIYDRLSRRHEWR